MPQPAQAGRGPRISSRAGGSEFRPRQGFASGKTLARRRRRPICDGEASGYDSSSLSSASSEPLCPSRPRPAGDPGFHPARAELNSARGKVLPPAKRLHGAGAAHLRWGSQRLRQQQLVVGLVRAAVPQPAQAGRGPRISSRAGGIEFRPRQGFASGKTLARRRRRPSAMGKPAATTAAACRRPRRSRWLC